MPNGGSDCCGTCWFNRNNDGKPGYPGAGKHEMPHCTIRHVDVPNPFYTYCANHPHKNPRRIDTPLGPIYTGDSMGNRRVLMPLSDTEDARLAHLRLLSEIPEQPTEDYPAGASFEETVIAQLADWKEARAIPELERIAAFKPVDPSPASPFFRDQQRLVRLAQLARAYIRGESPPEDRTETMGQCLFCGSQVQTSPPVKGHLVECAQCHAVLVAGHSRVIGGFDPRHRERFGAELTFPPEPPPCLLPGSEPGKPGGTPVALRCPFCKIELLDPLPGVMRKVMCPGCDQWLIPVELQMATGARKSAKRDAARPWIIAAIILLSLLIVWMITMALP